MIEETRAKITRNSAKCLECNEELESTHRHDYVTCSCGNLSVDGGLAYVRRCYANGLASWRETSTYGNADA